MVNIIKAQKTKIETQNKTNFKLNKQVFSMFIRNILKYLNNWEQLPLKICHFNYSRPLNNVGIGAPTPSGVQNLHITFSPPQNLIAYCCPEILPIE